MVIRFVRVKMLTLKIKIETFVGNIRTIFSSNLTTIIKKFLFCHIGNIIIMTYHTSCIFYRINSLHQGEIIQIIILTCNLVGELVVVKLVWKNLVGFGISIRSLFFIFQIELIQLIQLLFHCRCSILRPNPLKLLVFFILTNYLYLFLQFIHLLQHSKANNSTFPKFTFYFNSAI